MGVSSRVVAVASVVTAATITFACSGGASSQSQCEDFVQLTQDCYARAGKTLSANPAACSDPTAVTDQQRTQIACVLEHQGAYCQTIQASVSRDAGAVNPQDPELVKLNACYAAATLASPCKDAVLAMADCGVGYGFGTCNAQASALATCILQHKDGACSLTKPGRTSSTLTPEEQAYQKCQSDALRAGLDAGM